MVVNRVKNRLTRALHGPMESVFRWVDDRRMSRVPTLREIPFPRDREGGLGTTSYAEWCYTIGLFQTLIFQNALSHPIRMLDVGCGTGRLYLAAKPYLGESGTYLGIDVNPWAIERCKRLYGPGQASFLWTESSNGHYAPGVSGGPRPWPIPDGAMTIVTALSVWTHLREEDWKFYLGEVSRVLAPGSRAVITFFVKDDLYRPELKSSRISRFYPQAEKKWIFDTPAYGSQNWMCPSWVKVPEVAIAVDEATFHTEIARAGLSLLTYYPGQWKDQPGFFFQDVAILEKN